MTFLKVKNKHASRLESKDSIYGFLFVAPLVLGYLFFILGPMVSAFYTSLTNRSLLHDTKFIGFENYKNIFLNDNVFWKIFGNTAYFSIGLVTLNMLLAFGLALILKQKLAGIGFYRTAFFTPVITSIVSWSIMWKFILGPENGLMNQVLNIFGIKGPSSWLFDMKLTMPTVIVVSVLKGVGSNMVIFLSSLYNVPDIYYEAADLDGASSWHKLKNVTLPMISPTIFMLLVMTMIASLKVFGQIYVMTGGGPANATSVLVYYIYEKAFKQYEFGYASAIAFILFIIILLLTIAQWNVKKRWVHYEE